MRIITKYIKTLVEILLDLLPNEMMMCFVLCYTPTKLESLTNPDVCKPYKNML